MAAKSHHLLLAFAAATLAPGPAFAQTVREATTPAGVRIWDFPDDDADRFAIAVLVGVGARDEAPQHAGIAHFLEHTLFLSTTTRPKTTDDDEMTRLGLRCNGYTSSEVTVYHVSGRAEHWRFMVDWLADHVLHPKFDEAEVEGERRTVLQEIATTGPDFRALTYENLLYGDHPLARSIGGYPGTVRAIAVDDLREFHRRHYHARNLAVGFSGRVSTQECFAAVQEAFAGVTPGEPHAAEPPTQRTGDLWTNRSFTDRTEVLQYGYHLRSSDPAELAALLVAAAHLETRFFAEAREKHHLAYAPTVELIWGRDVQRLHFEVPTSDRDDVAALARIADELVRELQQLDESRIGAAITRAQANFSCSSATHLAAAMELAAWAAWRGAAIEEFTASLARIRPGDVATVAERHLRADRRYSLSGVPLLGSSHRAWALLTLLAVASLVALRLYGARWLAAARSRLRRAPQATKGRMLRMPERERVRPVDADEVERSIQRYFEEEDRANDDR